MGHITQPKTHDRQIKFARGKGQGLRIGLHQTDVINLPTVQQPVAAEVEHFTVDVENHDLTLRPHIAGQQPCEVA